VTLTGAFAWTHVVPPTGEAAGIVRAGIDRVEVDEFQRTVDVAGQPFIENIFTPQEVAFCGGRIDRLATRFAAKEATAKVLGTGFRHLGWHEVEVVTSAHGEPHLVLRDRAQDRAAVLGMASISVSLTHTAVAAEAFVVALCAAADAAQWIREEINHG
jgi:holo-[acyl-carrier protein] synthase